MTYVKHQQQEDVLSPTFGDVFEAGEFLNNIGVPTFVALYASATIRISNPISVAGYNRFRISNLTSSNATQYASLFSFFKNNTGSWAQDVSFSKNQKDMRGDVPEGQVYSVEYEITDQMLYLVVANHEMSSNGDSVGTTPIYTLIKD